MDLYINTLTGTVFEFRVNPYEAILSIKAKIQRNEGIPIFQQHLIWQSNELEDDYCLHDYNIKSGSTLTLVLAMRDGPINMRRVDSEESSFQEVVDYMDANKDEVWDKLMNDEQQVTLLVFRDGDQLNFFRVYDRGDGVFSPYSDSPSATSFGANDNGKSKENTEENVITKNKMMSLKKKLKDIQAKKKHEPRAPSAPRPNSKTYRKRPLYYQNRLISSRLSSATKEKNPSAESMCSPNGNSSELIPEHSILPNDKAESSPDAKFSEEMARLQKNSTSSLSNIAECNSGFSNQSNDNDSVSSGKSRYLMQNISSLGDSALSFGKSKSSKLSSLGSSNKRVLKPIGALNKRSSSEILSEFQSPRIDTSHKGYDKLPEIPNDKKTHANQKSDKVNIQHSKENEDFDRRLEWVKPDSVNRVLSNHNNKHRTTFGCIPSAKSYRKSPENRSFIKVKSGKIHPHGNITHLPPVRTTEKRIPPTLTGKKKIRCLVCAKKLGLATTYLCRCGSKFCSMHRYPETHSCSYDYKTEGRKLLSKNNPVVAAPKLPKI